MSSKIPELRVLFSKLAHGIILDAGCNVAGYARVLKKQGTVVGVEIDLNALRKAPYEHKILASVTDLPFKTEIFDFVWATAVIEHVIADCISEIIRVGKEIFFLTPNKNAPVDVIRRILGKKGTWQSPDHVRLYTIGELKKYGNIYGEGVGLPGRSFWARFPFLNRICFYLPSLSYIIFLHIVKKQIKSLD
jgi:SAM-dependent methyltransferase